MFGYPVIFSFTIIVNKCSFLKIRTQDPQTFREIPFFSKYVNPFCLKYNLRRNTIEDKVRVKEGLPPYF